ncbi:hypothetical protein [Streptomyces sp. TRM49041]|nr:hypothetical protein [Streptomyces sp. TRM49041]
MTALPPGGWGQLPMGTITHPPAFGVRPDGAFRRVRALAVY